MRAISVLVVLVCGAVAVGVALEPVAPGASTYRFPSGVSFAAAFPTRASEGVVGESDGVPEAFCTWSTAGAAPPAYRVTLDVEAAGPARRDLRGTRPALPAGCDARPLRTVDPGGRLVPSPRSPVRTGVEDGWDFATDLFRVAAGSGTTLWVGSKLMYGPRTTAGRPEYLIATAFDPVRWRALAFLASVRPDAVANRD